MRKKRDSIDAMGTEPLGRLLIRFSLPPIVGMMVNALYNVVDRVFIGQGVGSLALAGVTLSFPIMIGMNAMSVLVGVGANSLFSIRMGEGRREEAERILGNAAVLLVVFPAIASLLCIWKLDWLLSFMGASAEVLPYARDYAFIVLLGSALGTASFGLTHFIRSDGHPKTAMLSQLIGGVTNLVLDPIFIFVFHMGVKGAAWATVISQIFSFVYCLVYFRSKWTNTPLRVRDMRLEFRRIVFPFLTLGTSSFLMSVANVFVNFVLNKGVAVHSGSHHGLAIMGIIMAYSSVIFMPVMGLTQGAQPLIGYNYGARKYHRLKKLYGVSVIFGTVMMVAGFIVSQSFPHYVMLAFSRGETELVEAGARALRLFSLALPFIAFPIMTGTLFQATGHPVESIILSMSRQVLIFIPLLILMPRFFLNMGWAPLDGVFLAAPISDIFSAVLAVFLLCRFRQQLKRRAQADAELLEESAL